MNEERLAMFTRLVDSWLELGPRARAILVVIAERMVAGKKAHGDDFSAGRDWTKEALEEFLDAAVYFARSLIKC